ncbi:autotransporter domain-containing protein [Rickettsia australis]|uniref:Cell surface antigen n=1 Tax=Rickettsia australis (strain Cutlack) TaxID=1105110 RepID=H8K8W3_RICAC|nr:autotransporter domain-containing protein [Rickettsia australis]AFC70483.1 cell surface antigen [Rickettsia australis str. Cutlack]
MNKLTEQNLLKKSRFLKYSMLASISVGAVMVMPVEGMAMSKEAFRTELSRKLSLNKDTISTSPQIGTVIVPESEVNTYTTSAIREMEISKQPKAFNPLKDIPIEDHYKVVARSKSDVGKARNARPITRSKTLVGAEKVEQNQNNYTPEPTEQTPQKPEMMITASSPTVSPASNGFVTAPNTPNTTLASPEHYTMALGTPSSTPATPYQPTQDAQPNDHLGAKTPPNTNSKAVRRLSFSSSEPQQTVQPSKSIVPPIPTTPIPLPINKSSTEIAAGMVSNILRVNKMLGIKLAEVESTIKNTQGKKNKKPLQQLQKQIVLSQKKTKALKLEAAAIGIKIKELDEENRSLASWNKKTGGVKNKRELDKDSAKVKENNKKIDALQQKLTNKNEEANSLSREIGGIVLTKPQGKAPVTEMPLVGPFLNQQQQLEVLTQQQKVNAARQAVVNKRRMEVNEVKRNSAEYKDLISERGGVQLEQNQQHIAEAKTKKQQQKDNKQSTEREKKRKEENYQKEKARDILGLREDIANKMQQISNANTTSNMLQELELKVGAIEDKKQRQEAQKQLSKIKKQEKAIKVAADGAQKILNDAKKEVSRTKLKKLQEQMGNYVAMVTNDKIEGSIKKLEGLVLTPSTTASIATISKQLLTAKSTMPLSHELQRTLPEDEDGYLEPIKVQQQIQENRSKEGSNPNFTTYLDLYPEEEGLKSIDLGLGSLPIGASVIPQYVEELNNLASFPSLSQIQQEKSLIITNMLLSETSALSDDEFRAVANEIHPKIQPILTYNRKKETEAKLVKAETAHNQAVQNAIKTPNSTQAKEAVENAAKLFGQHNNSFKLTQDLRDEHRQKYYKTPKKVTDSINSLDLVVLAESQQLKEPRSKSLEALDLAGSVSSQLKQAEYKSVLSPSINGLEDLSGSNVMKLGKLKSEHEKITNDYKAKELELDTLNHDDPKFKKLMLEVFEMSKEKIWLEGEIKYLDTESKPKVTESKPVFLRSSSASSLNSLYNGHDLSSRDVVPPVDTLTIETNKGSVDTYIRVLSNKIQKMEELLGSSSSSEELTHIKEAIAYISNSIHDVNELDARMLLAINAQLQEHDEKISSLLLEQYTSEEAEDIFAQSLLQEMLVSDGKSESTLPVGHEELEDTEVTEFGIQKAGDTGLLALHVSSNECALALSDDREKECLELGDGSEDEEGYDSGFEEEAEIIEQLSDYDGDNLKITEVDTAIPLEQKAKKEMQTQISENAPTLNQAKVVNTIVNNMIRNRLDASMNMANNIVAVGAGDEEESCIKRGLWMRGMYGTNNHGRVENMNGYRGTNKGATIGFDVEIDNNILGIAYSNVHSVFKFKNSKNNDKELIDSHVISIYGQKELPRNFALQALVSASKNFIKDKTTYSYGDTKIGSNVKHRNHSYNAEALLNYNYLLQNKFVITPNIGLRYGKSRDGVYNETGINVQEIALTMKENNILSGIVGTKVKVPLKDALKFNNLGLTFQGAVEHTFKEKTQRINRVVKIFDNTFKQDYLIPKQPKTSYNLGTGIIGSIKNTTISLDYNYYLNKHYRSHQGSVKLKVNL